jgi:hypothetical protein
MDLMKKTLGRNFWETKMSKFESARTLLRMEQEEGSIKSSLGGGNEASSGKSRKGRRSRGRKSRKGRPPRGAKANALASANDPHAFDRYVEMLPKFEDKPDATKRPKKS